MMHSESSDEGVKMPVGSGVLADTTKLQEILDSVCNVASVFNYFQLSKGNPATGPMR